MYVKLVFDGIPNKLPLNFARRTTQMSSRARALSKDAPTSRLQHNAATLCHVLFIVVALCAASEISAMRIARYSSFEKEKAPEPQIGYNSHVRGTLPPSSLLNAFAVVVGAKWGFWFDVIRMRDQDSSCVHIFPDFPTVR